MGTRSASTRWRTHQPLISRRCVIDSEVDPHGHIWTQGASRRVALSESVGVPLSRFFVMASVDPGGRGACPFVACLTEGALMGRHCRLWSWARWLSRACFFDSAELRLAVCQKKKNTTGVHAATVNSSEESGHHPSVGTRGMSTRWRMLQPLISQRHCRFFPCSMSC